MEECVRAEGRGLAYYVKTRTEALLIAERTMLVRFLRHSENLRRLIE